MLNDVKLKTSPHPIFKRSIGGVVLCLLLSAYICHRATKTKTDFTLTKGVVEYIENSSPLYPNKHPQKYRYLKVTGYSKPFELFMGKESDDFSPAYEKLDALKPGDTIAVYYDESLFKQDDPVNRLVYFIDRGEESLFVKGSWEKWLAFFIAGFSVVLLASLFVLKRKGKIE